MIPIFQPSLGAKELSALAAVFADNWPGPGPRVKEFERAFADCVGTSPEQLIAVTSCTEGLFQAIAALELRPSDEVIVPTVSFIGAAHAVRAAGATLRLIDVDSRTLNSRLDQIEEAISQNTKAIVLLHYGGRLDWIAEIAALARSRNLMLIEDSACALGGRIQGRSYGTYGDIGLWSFDSMKLLVTGDGGMMRVESELLRARIFNRVHLGGVKPGHENAAGGTKRWWELDPISWGRLAFMNDLTAAIGLVQLGRIDSFIARRREIARMYDAQLSDLDWIDLPVSTDDGVPYFYWVQTPISVRDKLAYHLRESGVYTTFRYWPLHRTSLYQNGRSYPGADLASETTLLLPIHQNLSDADVSHIIDAVHRFEIQHL